MLYSASQSSTVCRSSMWCSALITKTRRKHVALKIKSTAGPKPRGLRWKSRTFYRKFVANKERWFQNRRGTMGKRRRAREAAVQYHFWRDLQRGEGPDKIDEFWEFCPAQPRVREFAQPLIEGMVAHLPEIDERIRRYCENYEFRRISAVDRNVLRLAIYEMLYRDDIPPVVSINEAIELAKAYGGADSGRFVNGILDRIRKDLDRPAREPVIKRDS